MTQTAPIASTNLSRRALLAAIGAGAVFAAMPGVALAQSGAWARSDEALAILDGRTPVSGAVTVDLPMISENGAVVALGIAVNAARADGDHVSAIHVIAPANPYPLVASYRLPSARTLPRIDTRIRLNESQTVVVLAEMAGGDVLVGEREVRVTVSGCLTQSDTYETDSLFNVRVRVEPGPDTGVLTLINHPMETGLRTDANGNVVEKRLIERLDATFAGENVFTAEFHRSVSTNPYLRFFFQPEGAGELDLVWTEDTGATAEFTATV